MIKTMKKRFMFFILLFVFVFVTGCIGFLPPDNEDGGEQNEISLVISGNNKVAVGSTITLNAEIKIEGISQEVIWKSADSNIATVSQQGVVTGVSVGSTTITATSVEDNKIVGKYNIKVLSYIIDYTDDAPESISLTGVSEVFVNEVIILDYQTTPINASQSFTWESSNETVATVSGRGVVTFHSIGSVVITCKSQVNPNIKTTKTITVKSRNAITDYEQQTVNIIKETKNSILGVANYEYSDNGTYVKTGIGSGFVYKVEKVTNGYDHYLITNKHVVKGSDKLAVYLHFLDEEVDAELLGYDTKVDLAVVKFFYEELINPLRMYDSSVLEAGQRVIAIGNPEGFEFSSTATAGIISYPLRYVSDDTDDDGVNDWDAAFIQHDASINPGNSGGPLLNIHGDVIGINTMKFSAVDIDNMGFSIPTQTIAELIPYLEDGDAPQRATIGIQVIAIRDLLGADLTQSDYEYKIPDGITKGLYINGITPDSVAAQGGLLVDDILLVFNGVELKTSLELRSELNKIIIGANTKVEVVVCRNGQNMTLTLVF